MNICPLIRVVPLVCGLFISLAQASDVTITVNGRVIAKPCTVSTTDVLIDFGTLYAYNFITPQSTSEWRTFNLQLTNCPIGTSQVTATFSGTSDNTNYYANLATTDAAKNIQIELQDSLNTVLKNGSSKNLTVNNSSKSIDTPMRVRLISLNGGATQGAIQSEITVTYQYQ